jgi:outer membrane receptor protein involved in Fe transport
MSRIHTSLARFVFAACALFAFSIVVSAQTPTGTISGRVTDSNGGVIRGATVSITSPSLQGTQSQTTSENGDYIFRALLPGAYTVTVQTSGFTKSEESVRVAPSEIATHNVTLQPAAVTESVSVVTSDDTSFVTTVQAAANLNYGLINTLPTTKTLLSYVNLAPGVHNTGPDGNISIAGAMSFENLFLVNGAVITDNIRSEPMTLFIEDAIQEVTIATSGISAEFGRFTGGVINAVTKSGGNMFSGSFRTEFNNDDWRTTSPFGEPKVDSLNPVHSFTFGGPIRRDKIWFFGAGRFEDRETGEQTAVTTVPYTQSFQEERYEGKVTVALPRNQRLWGNYLHVNQRGENSNTASIGIDAMDLRSLISRRDPMSLTTINYTGTIGASTVVEAQYSARRWTIKDAGGLNPDRVQGTPVFDQNSGNSYWAPGFCGQCDDVRNNDNIFLKASYFKSTGRGSHNVVFGYDTFNDKQKGDNRQSATDYWMYGTSANIVGTDIYPVLDDGSFIVHWPLEVSSQGTNFRTHALFVNDTWTTTRNLTVNLGLRWDANRGRNSSDQLVADGSLLSPRLGVTYDLFGDGQTTVNASYARYAAALSNNVANSSSSAGTPSILVYQYTGPAFNLDPEAPQVPTDQVLAQAFADFDANQNVEGLYPLAQVTLPGVGTQIRESLKSPHADEFKAGVGRQLGSRGAVRLDFVRRNYGDFYTERLDTTTGTVTNELGEEFDLTLIENTNVVERKYTGVTVLGTYRAGARMDLGASYTLAKMDGNIEGENVNSGPLAEDALLRYPEYSEERWVAPKGDLLADQRHRARAWGTFMLPAGSSANNLSVGVLQQIESGTPYGAVADIFLSDAEGNPFVENPGYLTPPITTIYWFTDRDASRTATMYRTDLSLNFTRTFGSATRGFDVFAQFHILNLFNQFQAFNISNDEIDTTVLTAVNDPDGRLVPFNPFTETPVEGVHWEKGPNYGTVQDAEAYTVPRTFRFSLGLRF